MPSKKDPFRFTIKFTRGDPDHEAVANLLNARGNTKAQYLVDAVMHFERCTSKDTSVAILSDDGLLAHIERIVREAVRAECRGLQVQTTLEEEGMAPVPIAPDSPSDEEMDSESKAKIGESIRAFRR